MNEKKIIGLLKKYHALITPREATLLFKLAKRTNCQGQIVEIGSYKGGSTIILANAIKGSSICKVYAVDPHEGTRFYGIPVRKWGSESVPLNTLELFKENIQSAGVTAYVRPIVKTSEKASKTWRKPIKLLWIDGNHDFESVLIDVLSWERYVTLGGMIALHDYHNSDSKIISVGETIPRLEGPIKVVEFLAKTKRYNIKKTVDSTIYAEKRAHARAIERIKNHVLILSLRFIHVLKIILRTKFPKIYFRIDSMINPYKSEEFKDKEAKRYCK